MSKTSLASLLLAFIAAVAPSSAQSHSPSQSQGESQAVLDAIDRADAFSTQHQYQQALDAYREADRISHHTCADCLLGMVNMECYLGDFDTALDDAKSAQTVAGSDRMVAAQACEVRARLLVSTASSFDDARVKEAESQLRQALVLDPKKSNVRFDLGLLLLEQGRDAEGVAELRAYVSGPLASPRYVDRANRLIADPGRARALPSEDFSFSTLGGGTISKAGLRGKVVLLDFWASWCGPCRESLPAIADLHQKFAANSSFQIIGISADDDEAAWKSFIAANHMSWPQNIDLDGQVGRLFEVPGYPTYVLLDRDGAIAFRQTGFSSDSESNMAMAINRALAKPVMAQPPAGAASTATAAPAPALPATAPVPARARNIRVNFTPPPDDVENGDVRGGVYRNDFLGLSFKFPASWTAAPSEDLDALNREKMRRIERAEQAHPRDNIADSDSVDIAFPQIVFQASPSARYGAPSVVISVAQTDVPVLESALGDSSALQEQGIAILAAPHQVLIGKRSFVRTDTQSPQADPPVWTSTFETTVSEHFRVTFEIQARSKQELDQLAPIAQSLAILKP
jgi:thiol-disulfide isomerase/thioredoxin